MKKEKKQTCTKYRCGYAVLVFKKVGESWQTNSGHFTIYIDGYYCPSCGAGYGGC